MKKLFLMVLAIGMCASAQARDDKLQFPIKDALATPAAQEKLNPDISLHFGDKASIKKSDKMLGEWRTNKKTNAFNKTDQEACEWVFLSAVLELQERAAKEGGNAVVNIKSNYKNIETVSEETYVCGAGALMAGVALKGTVIKK